MPPPSPVWAWEGKSGEKVFRDATFQAAVKIEGEWIESKAVLLKVKHREKGKKEVGKSERK